LFKLHQDTPRSGLIGTLIYRLFDDSDCSFAIHIPQGDSTGKDDVLLWSAEYHKSLPVVMFYADCQHEVRKLTKGHRATLTFKIYARPTTDKTDSTAMVARLLCFCFVWSLLVSLS
jgi:hypothetical protein